MYDFTIRSKKIIIEYHGIAFHAKEKNQNWKSIFTNETPIENIEKRNIKNALAINNGFSLLEIWSDDGLFFNIER